MTDAAKFAAVEQKVSSLEGQMTRLVESQDRQTKAIEANTLTMTKLLARHDANDKDIERHERRLGDHEKRLRTMEQETHHTKGSKATLRALQFLFLAAVIGLVVMAQGYIGKVTG